MPDAERVFKPCARPTGAGLHTPSAEGPIPLCLALFDQRRS